MINSIASSQKKIASLFSCLVVIALTFSCGSDGDPEPKAENELPAVTTMAASEVKSFSAVLKGSIVINSTFNATEKGFMFLGTTDAPKSERIVINQSFATPEYQYAVSELKQNTVYRYQAYVRGAYKSDPAAFIDIVGAVVEFTTAQLSIEIQELSPWYGKRGSEVNLILNEPLPATATVVVKFGDLTATVKAVNGNWIPVTVPTGITDYAVPVSLSVNGSAPIQAPDKFTLLGEWVTKKDLPFDGDPRLSFVAGSQFYGAFTKGSVTTLYSYDVASDTWNNFSTVPANSIVAFSVADKGYVMDWDGNLFEFSTTDVNVWIPRQKFPGAKRSNAVAFTVNGKAYVGLGGNSLGESQNDLWEYNPTTDNWNQHSTNFPGNAGLSILYLYAFAAGDIAYVYVKSELYIYTPATNTWVKKTNIPISTPTTRVCGFVLHNDLYMSYDNSLFAFDNERNEWKWLEEVNLPAAKQTPMAFVVNDNAILAGGVSGDHKVFEYRH